MRSRSPPSLPRPQPRAGVRDEAASRCETSCVVAGPIPRPPSPCRPNLARPCRAHEHPLNALRRLRLGDRQREPEARAALGPVLRPDPAALGLDEPLRDREAETRAAVRARPGGVAAPE